MIEVFHWSLRFKDINKKKKKYCWLAFSEEDGEGEKEGDSGYQQVYLFLYFLFAAFALLPLRLMGVFLINHITSVYELRILNKTKLFYVLKSQFLTKYFVKLKRSVCGVFITRRNFVRLKLRGQTELFFFFGVCVCEFLEGNYFIVFSIKLADLCCLGWFVFIWANF